MRITRIVTSIVSLALTASIAYAGGTTVFTYQGRLLDGGEPANGPHDFEFSLWDAQVGGNQIGATQILNGVPVADGLFTVQIDFGADAFDNTDRWLEVTVNDVPLLPRQPITRAPYAIQTRGIFVDADGNVGIGTTNPTEKLDVEGNIHASGSIISGSSVKLCGTQHKIACNNALEFHVEVDTNGPCQGINNRASRLEGGGINPDVVNLIGGHVSNTVTVGVDGATIGGGGLAGSPNRVTGDFGTVGGGASNISDGGFSTVAGGFNNTAGASNSTVGGGRDNRAIGFRTTIGGGFFNTASGADSTLGGGNHNIASGDWSTVGGGDQNEARGAGATVGGGGHNEASGKGATVGGGDGNIATGLRSTVSGGGGNTAGGGSDSTVGGGLQNVASGDSATVGGGSSNIASRPFATVGGGSGNTASGSWATVAGGQENTALDRSTVAGGANNTANGLLSTVGGGLLNSASGERSTVGGGAANIASGLFATVPGGQSNDAGGDHSFAAGRGAKANHIGTFVWADATNQDFASFGANTFNVRASGGTCIYSNSAATVGVLLAPGATAWSIWSDRSVKANFAPVDGRDILERLASIPIESWNLKSQDPSIRHIGPMAQDFYAAFAVGEDDRHISTIDADGVALAAIQGLYQVVQERDSQIETLKARLSALEQLVAKLSDEQIGGAP